MHCVKISRFILCSLILITSGGLVLAQPGLADTPSQANPPSRPNRQRVKPQAQAPNVTPGDAGADPGEGDGIAPGDEDPAPAPAPDTTKPKPPAKPRTPAKPNTPNPGQDAPAPAPGTNPAPAPDKAPTAKPKTPAKSNTPNPGPDKKPAPDKSPGNTPNPAKPKTPAKSKAPGTNPTPGTDPAPSTDTPPAKAPAKPRATRGSKDVVEFTVKYKGTLGNSFELKSGQDSGTTPAATPPTTPTGTEPGTPAATDPAKDPAKDPGTTPPADAGTPPATDPSASTDETDNSEIKQANLDNAETQARLVYIKKLQVALGGLFDRNSKPDERKKTVLQAKLNTAVSDLEASLAEYAKIDIKDYPTVVPELIKKLGKEIGLKLSKLHTLQGDLKELRRRQDPSMKEAEAQISKLSEEVFEKYQRVTVLIHLGDTGAYFGSQLPKGQRLRNIIKGVVISGTLLISAKLGYDHGAVMAFFSTAVATPIMAYVTNVLDKVIETKLYQRAFGSSMQYKLLTIFAEELKLSIGEFTPAKGQSLQDKINEFFPSVTTGCEEILTGTK